METVLAGSLIEEQFKLEEEATDEGVRRYFANVADAIKRGEGSRLRPVERLQGYWYEAVRLMVQEEIDLLNQSDPPGQSRHIYSPIVRAAGAKTCAAAAVQEITGLMLREIDGTKEIVCIHAVGRAVIACLHSRMLKRTPGRQDESTAWSDLTVQFKRLDSKRINWWAFRTLDEPLTNAKAVVSVGGFLLSVIKQVCTINDGGIFRPAFYTYKKHMKGKMVPHWKFSDATAEALSTGHEHRASLRPCYLPMIVPPYPWQTDEHGCVNNQGGYITIRTPLVSNPTRRQKQIIKEADMSLVCEALNYKGSQGFRINPRILGVIKHYVGKGGGVAGIPLMNNPPPPERPEGDWSAFYKDVQDYFSVRDRSNLTLSEGGEYVLRARRYHRNIVNLTGERELFFSRIGWADRFTDRPIYFPHKTDFRGRYYPVPPLLNHQGDDLCRGLLMFAEPGPSSPRSFYHLAVHAANVWGHDKKSIDERFRWTRDHAADICRWAANPTEDDGWMQAEKPLQFLLACMGLADEEVGSRIPVETDGTCNGLQHYSAMSLDATGGRLVNLLPSTTADTPEDVYMAVAKGVPAKVDPQWHQYINRKSCKTPVMTTYYGVTTKGAIDQVMSALEDQGIDRKTAKMAARAIAPAVLAQVGDTCPGASAMMGWLRSLARTVAEAGRLFEFVGPFGFPVSVPYRLRRATVVQTAIGAIRTMAEHEDDPVWVEKQVSGSAPHVVHQIDSAHDTDVTVRCKHSGTAFAGRHDCFMTHAGSKDTLDVHIRDSFVDLHSADLPKFIYDQFVHNHPDLEIPPPPPKGTLDLAGVKISANFFS